MVHISEEARNANIAIPYGILFATLSGVALGWGKFLYSTLPLSRVVEDIRKVSMWPWPSAWERIYRILSIILSDNQWLQLSDAIASPFGIRH